MKVTNSLISIALASFLIGCGGGSSNNNTPKKGETPKPDNQKKELKGRVVDGYIKGAKVFLDINNNAIKDPGEPESEPTGDDGKFTITIESSKVKDINNKKLISQGGIDVDTNETFKNNLIFKLPENHKDKEIYITPISTLLSQDNTKEDKILEILDINKEDLSKNPIENLKLYKANLKVQKTLEILKQDYSELSSKITPDTKNFDQVIGDSENAKKLIEYIDKIDENTFSDQDKRVKVAKEIQGEIKEDKFALINPNIFIDKNSVTVKPSEIINFDNNALGQKVLVNKLIENLSYWNEYEQAVKKLSSQEDYDDNRITDIDAKNGKIAVSSYYHNTLVIFDVNAKKQGVSLFGTLDGAAKNEQGKLVIDGHTDDTSAASENYLTQATLSDDAKYVYLNLDTTSKRYKSSHKPTLGIFKAQIKDDLTISLNPKDHIHKEGNYYSFTLLGNGQILAITNDDKLELLNADTLEKNKDIDIKDIDIRDIVAKNGKVFILSKDNSKNAKIQELNIDNGSVTNIDLDDTYPYEVDRHNGFFMNITNDAKKLVYYNVGGISGDSFKICTIDISGGDKTPKCSTIQTHFETSISGSISPDNKLLAIPTYRSEGTMIINIEEEPTLLGRIEAKEYSTTASFISSSQIAVESDAPSSRKKKSKQTKIKVYDIKSETITKDNILSIAKEGFKSDFEEFFNIQVSKEENGTLKPNKISFPELQPINTTYKFSNNFNDYINDKGEIIKYPESKIDGFAQVILEIYENGNPTKKEKFDIPVSIAPKEE